MAAVFGEYRIATSDLFVRIGEFATTTRDRVTFVDFGTHMFVWNARSPARFERRYRQLKARVSRDHR